jgi:Flp pilus assembly pilin Flp
MKRWPGYLRRLLASEEGLEVVEYAIIVGLIVVATITAIALLGAWALNVFETTNANVGAS